MLPVIGRLASTALSTVLALGLATSGAVALAAAADVRGPDVSSHQHPSGYVIKWSAARADGAQFAFVKATEGLAYTNPYFAQDFAGIRSATMVRGAYHYARPSGGAANAVGQARHFVAVSGTLRASGDLPPVLDLERADGLNPAALITWTRAYLTEVTRLTGRTPIIYTYPAFWRSSMGNTTVFSSYPLWIATWGPAPSLIGGWSSYTFWQYTDQGRLAGMAAPVDMSIFNGSLAGLRALARQRAAVPTLYVPKMTAKLSKKKTRVNKAVRLKGATSRTLAGETAYRQGYWSGSWHTWAKKKITKKGKYSFKIRPTVKAVNKYRVYVGATSKHTAAATRTVTLRVK